MNPLGEMGSNVIAMTRFSCSSSGIFKLSIAFWAVQWLPSDCGWIQAWLARCFLLGPLSDFSGIFRFCSLISIKRMRFRIADMRNGYDVKEDGRIMFSISNIRLLIPTDWQKFETISLEALKIMYDNPNFIKNGRHLRYVAKMHE